MNSPKDPLIELRADGRVAVLTFEVRESSKLTKQFIAELSKLVKLATTKQPLVYNTDRSVSVVYRAAVEDVALRDPFSLRPLFSDIGRRVADVNARIEINATCDAVKLPDGGVWADDRTPETTPRYSLPVFDSEAMAQTLGDLVVRWTTAGNIVEIQPWAPPRRPEPTPELNVSTDPDDWDVADPRRYLPNAAETIAEIRRIRRERGLRREDGR